MIKDIGYGLEQDVDFSVQLSTDNILVWRIDSIKAFEKLIQSPYDIEIDMTCIPEMIENGEIFFIQSLNPRTEEINILQFFTTTMKIFSDFDEEVDNEIRDDLERNPDWKHFFNNIGKF